MLVAKPSMVLGTSKTLHVPIASDPEPSHATGIADSTQAMKAAAWPVAIRYSPATVSLPGPGIQHQLHACLPPPQNYRFTFSRQQHHLSQSLLPTTITVSTLPGTGTGTTHRQGVVEVVLLHSVGGAARLERLHLCAPCTRMARSRGRKAGQFACGEREGSKRAGMMRARARVCVCPWVGALIAASRRGCLHASGAVGGRQGRAQLRRSLRTHCMAVTPFGRCCTRLGPGREQLPALVPPRPTAVRRVGRLNSQRRPSATQRSLLRACLTLSPVQGQASKISRGYRLWLCAGWNQRCCGPQPLALADQRPHTTR